jgi:hypothetical protein
MMCAQRVRHGSLIRLLIEVHSESTRKLMQIMRSYMLLGGADFVQAAVAHIMDIYGYIFTCLKDEAHITAAEHIVRYGRRPDTAANSPLRCIGYSPCYWRAECCGCMCTSAGRVPPVDDGHGRAVRANLGGV